MEKNLQSTKPNPASTCRATIFFSGLGQCTKAGAMEPQSRLFVRERARLLVLFPRPFPFQTKKLGTIWRKMPNLQNRIPHRRAERLFFFWARPMHQGGRNGATKLPFRARKGALASVVSKAPPFSNTKFGDNLEKNAQSTKPNPASTCRATIFFWARPMHQGGRSGVSQPIFRDGRGALRRVFFLMPGSAKSPGFN